MFTPNLKRWISLTLVLCLIPALIQLMGGDFGTLGQPFDPLVWAKQPGSIAHLKDALHHALAGSFVHTILEWSAVCAAGFTAILALIHFAIERDAVMPILGLTLFYAGCMDAFHTLAADRLLSASVGSSDLVPFTWALCRMFSAVILVAGGWLLLSSRQRHWRQRFMAIILASLSLGLLAYTTIWLCLLAPQLPQTQFPGALVTRPWDLGPLLLFMLAGAWILPRLNTRYPSQFAQALWVSMLPQSIAQLHMVFGSSQLFDSNFNVAHGLKVLAYLVPLAGLCASYIELHRDRNRASQAIKQANLALAEAERLARQRADDLDQTLNNLYQTQGQLVHAEKMSGLGQLAAGMAHEINNPVNFIYGNLLHARNYSEDLLRLVEEYQRVYPDRSTDLRMLEDDIDVAFLRKDLPQLFDSMTEGVQRIRKIASTLRAFSGLDEAGYKPTNLNMCLDDTLTVLSHRLLLGDLPDRQSVQVTKTYGELPLVFCDRAQINQALMHLITNAIDALKEAIPKRQDDPGWQPALLIASESYTHEEDEIDQPTWVVLRIADNGMGIASAAEEKLFDPFFSTKPIGQGTGLGLSIADRVIASHQGKIRWSSTPNEGTIFEIWLPADETAVLAETNTEEPR